MTPAFLLACPLCKSNLMLTIDETIPPTNTTLGLKCFCGLDVRSNKNSNAETSLSEVCGILGDIERILTCSSQCSKII